MNRRSLLALLAGGSAALAGCSFAEDAGPSVTPAALDDDTESVTGVPRTTADEETPKTDDGASPPDHLLGVANVGSLAAGERRVAFPFRYRSDDAARVELQLLRAADADGPLTNADPWTNTVRLRWLPPFGNPYGQPPVDAFDRRLPVARERGYDTALAFAPTTDDGLASSVPALERDEEGYWRLAGTGTWLPETVELDAEASVTGEFALVGHPEGTGRPTGTYRWARPGDAVAVHVWDGASPGPDDPSRFAGASVPDLPRDGPTYWFHGADAETTAFLRPDAERVAAPARLDVAMHNRGPTPLGGTPTTTRCTSWPTASGSTSGRTSSTSRTRPSCQAARTRGRSACSPATPPTSRGAASSATSAAVATRSARTTRDWTRRGTNAAASTRRCSTSTPPRST